MRHNCSIHLLSRYLSLFRPFVSVPLQLSFETFSSLSFLPVISSGLPTFFLSRCNKPRGNDLKVELFGFEDAPPSRQQPEYEQHTKDCPRSRSNSGYQTDCPRSSSSSGYHQQQTSSGANQQTYPIFSPPLLAIHPHSGIIRVLHFLIRQWIC